MVPDTLITTQLTETSLKAIVHIGIEKTGTTSIQHFLHLNRRRLAKAGFHFLRSAGKINNRTLPAYCIDDSYPDEYLEGCGVVSASDRLQFRETVCDDLHREISELPSSIHTVVISSEHFHSRLPGLHNVERVRDLLKPLFDDIRVICYLREQSAACTSWYSTSLKNGESETLNQFMRRCSPANYYFNYQKVLGNWERVFGEGTIEAGIFDRSQLLNGDLLDDFAARLDPALVGQLKKSARRENESLRPEGQAILRGLNSALFDGSKEPDIERLRERCLDYIYHHLRGRGERLDLRQQRRFYADFRDSNDAVKARYFPELPVLFSLPEQQAEPTKDFDTKCMATLTSILKMIAAGAPDTAYPALATREIFNSVGESLADIETHTIEVDQKIAD